MTFELRRLDATLRDDFLALHSDSNEAGWCRCVAWWVAGWDGWGERSAEENAALRNAVFASGEGDGYLLYEGSEPVAWCQVAPRERLPGIAADFGHDAPAGTWSIGCVFVAPGHRRKGVARALLERVVADLEARGAKRIEAYPRRGAEHALEMWNGPAELWAELGFEPAGGDGRRAVVALATPSTRGERG